MNEIIPLDTIKSRILFIRGKKGMLSAHLAELYGVETRGIESDRKKKCEKVS
ncbi:hypothetical protein BMS3Abin06_01137 [bacterium BMS3Abin06]|nr:hypothetical protein BMS3Abin06_01137 [bacterium BMS3Abin06]